MDKQSADKIQRASEACLVNAEACLAMAEREFGKGADHLCFHLALLSLEEIGKSILIKIGYTVSASTVEKPGLETALDDHVKKIFWALWHGFLMGDKMKPQEIEQLKGLATGLHESRLDYLYTDPENPIDPKDKLKDGEVKRLIDVAKLRLKMERETAGQIQDFTEEETEELKWFFTACEDKEKRVEIFGHLSIEKLKEFGNGKAWIKWLYDLEKKNREEMMRLTQH
jgi:AbiV family abortive infection protein